MHLHLSLHRLFHHLDPDSLLGRGKEKPVGSVGLDKLIAAVAKPKVGAAHSGTYR